MEQEPSTKENSLYSADNYSNNEDIEFQWALKAYEHAETYFKIICTVDNRYLKLTRRDDFIYKKFRENFPDLEVTVVTDKDLKEDGAKEKWREFVKGFEHIIESFNQGMLLRVDARKDVSDENTLLVLKTQFLAIEIARNREGCNQAVRKLYRHQFIAPQKKEGTEKASSENAGKVKDSQNVEGKES